MGTSDLAPEPREVGFYIPNWMEDESFLGSPFLFAYGGELTFCLGESFTQEDIVERLEDLHIHIRELVDSGLGADSNVFFSTFTFERTCLNEVMEKLEDGTPDLAYIAEGSGTMSEILDELGSKIFASRKAGTVTIDDQRFIAIK